MTKLKFLSAGLTAGLIAAAMLAAPASAREHHLAPRHVTEDQAVAIDGYADTAPYDSYASSCVPAPRVGAFASDPWTYETPCEPSPGYVSGY